ncbi:LytTR family DNA-binding domain-containing protein [Martelella mediterranea]|uniref:LytTR family transcriptional regulator n=1 Tax=Martelella mediterranea TaxID=293089 RepID=A0A4V2V3S7_9HYPH|nr:LytTR family DNA-binding domain-containing protein [Martelella mediterranea]TCT35265.1 LytTR family transcriptional regulator [Martelella mediterranea]
MNETPENFVVRSGLHFALREMRRDFSSWRTYGLLTIVILILAWSGPFGTLSEFAFAERLVYWVAVVCLTYGAAHFFGNWAGWYLRSHKVPAPLHFVLITAAAGLASTVAVIPVTILVSGTDAILPGALFSTAYHAFLVAAAVVAAMMLLGENEQRTEKAVDVVAADEKATLLSTPRLVARLPLQKRGRLLSVSVSDHYVDVVTSAGREMLLMRLKDAIDETAPVEGLRIHRSHWVALEAVAEVAREDGRIVVVTSAGARLPVSRTYLPALREAGLTPG